MAGQKRRKSTGVTSFVTDVLTEQQKAREADQRLGLQAERAWAKEMGVVGRLGQFALIFPDAPGGKIFKLRRVAALRRGGVIVARPWTYRAW